MITTPYRVERWTNRGIMAEEAKTKREANNLAESMRSMDNTTQTVVVKPNGDIRVCRNKFSANR